MAELKNTGPNAKRPSPGVALAVLLLAVLQLSSATHQFDHQLNELNDVCAVCLELERLDDASTAASVEIVFSAPQFTVPEFTPTFTVVRKYSISQPRAPPLS